MKEIKYSYAYDENYILVNINEIDSGIRCNRKFYCISCGEEIIPRLGSVNAHHFAHKIKSEHCCVETYLHKLAKYLIKDKFNKSRTFNVVLLQKGICNYRQRCNFFEENKCYESKYKKFDLKEYYDCCSEEKKIGDYVADLLLSDSTGKYKEPVLIEIKVSHGCTSEKIQSGYRIIEIEIKNEDDVKSYIKSSWDYSNQNKYYNFHDALSADCLKKKELTRAIVDKNAYVNIDKISCKEKDRKKRVDSMLELNFYANRNYNDTIYRMLSIDYALENGCEIQLDNFRCCYCCKYSNIILNVNEWSYCMDNMTCELSEKKKTPYKPKWSVAKYCRYYSFDKSKLQKIIRPKLSDIIIENVR